MFISYVKFFKTSFDEGILHSQLYASFPANIGRILYKKENVLNNNCLETYALVFSEKKPFSNDNVIVLKNNEINVSFIEGSIFNYEIKLMPEYKRYGKRLPQKVLKKRIEYVKKHLENAGTCLLTDVKEVSSEVLHVSHKTGMQTLTTYIYKGTIRVDDPEKLKYAYEHGIGHGKAYGCGMLLLRR